jgi:hypothetical protein
MSSRSTSRLSSRGAALWLAALLASAAAGAVPGPRGLYDALRSAPPAGEAYDVAGLTLKRDAFRLRFASGTIQFLQTDGRRFGAVFNGSGSLELSPATEIERQHLALVTGAPNLATLKSTFDRVVLLFTDGTDAEIASAGKGGPGPSPRAGETVAAFRSWQRTELKSNLVLRLLDDRLREIAPASGVFLAWVPWRGLPPSIVAVDPGGLDWLIGRVAGESSALLATGDNGGLWYCAGPEGVSETAAPPPAARALWYGIETTIARDAELSGSTTIRVVPTVENLRVLRLNLADRLRIQSAEVTSPDGAEGRAVDFIQEAEGEDSDPAILLPSAPPRGAALQVRVAYRGREILRDAGDGNFLVGARDNWYPNLGFLHDLSSFDLTYRHPKELDVVSVGTKIGDRVEADTAVSVWKAERPIRVAGFNYGKFRSLERTDPESGMTVRVYTNPGTPDFIHSLNQRLFRLAAERNRTLNPDIANFISGIHAEQIGVAGSASLQSSGVSLVHVDPDILANEAIADTLATARIGRESFGGLPESRVAVTQQTQAFSGQSWPGLLYIPYIAALDPATRREIGLSGSDEFIERIVPHEFAHQWWGQLVGWGGYRDRWLSEGFAEFTASLVIESSGGAAKANDYWEKARRRILATPPGCQVSNAAAGPIAMGPRLSTPRNPGAYDAIVYTKGAFVLHMLRMAMRDWKSAKPDADFFDAMKEFAARYAGRNPSTRDFREVVERHASPGAAGSADGRLDWFFQQWVYGTDIPRLRPDLRPVKSAGGGYRLTGSVTQSGVSEDFRTIVQLFAELPKGELVHVASLPLVGNVRASLDLPIDSTVRPKRVLANPHHEVLARD